MNVTDKLAQPVRWSHLKHMSRSPLHYLHAVTAAEKKDTPQMLIGRAIDCFVFGGEQPPVVWTGGDRRGNEWKEFQVEHESRDILTVTEYDRARPCADAINAHPAASIVLQGERWLEWSWNYPATERDCTSHPDLNGRDFITDLKTSMTVQPHRFDWKIRDMRYHAQLAFYGTAREAMGLPPARDLYIVAAEYDAPFAVTVRRIGNHAREVGEQLNRQWMEMLKVCEENDAWGGYCDGILDFDIEEELELNFGDYATTEEVA